MGIEWAENNPRPPRQADEQIGRLGHLLIKETLSEPELADDEHEAASSPDNTLTTEQILDIMPAPPKVPVKQLRRLE
jgi:hypothetical protein